MIPAPSLIHEKQRRTLEALNITPSTIGDIFTAKGIIGTVLAIIMGVLTLSISTSFGNSPIAMVAILGLGAILAAEILIVKVRLTVSYLLCNGSNNSQQSDRNRVAYELEDGQ